MEVKMEIEMEFGSGLPEWNERGGDLGTGGLAGLGLIWFGLVCSLGTVLYVQESRLGLVGLPGSGLKGSKF